MGEEDTLSNNLLQIKTLADKLDFKSHFYSRSARIPTCHEHAPDCKTICPYLNLAKKRLIEKAYSGETRYTRDGARIQLEPAVPNAMYEMTMFPSPDRYGKCHIDVSARIPGPATLSEVQTAKQKANKILGAVVGYVRRLVQKDKKIEKSVADSSILHPFSS